MAKTKLAAMMELQGRRNNFLVGKLGVSPGTVSRWLSGERRIPKAKLPLIAGHLGVQEEEIA